jgi:ubiquitin-protein ligase E3 D
MQLAKHSDAGRLHDQEAVFHPPKSKNPEALLSLPEFIREPIPTNALLRLNPQTILSLPEFINEPVPESPMSTVLPPTDTDTMKNLRGRSMSAPSLSWIFNPTPKSPSPIAAEKKSHRRKRPGTSGGSTSTLSGSS